VTVSTDSIKEFTRREILRRSLQKARLLHVSQTPSDTNPKVTQASDYLEMKLADLQAEGGPIVTTTELATIDVAGGTTPETAIALPAATLDVQGTAMLIDSSGVETPILPMGQEQWQRTPDKTVLGSPSRYYVHRLLAVSLYLWPGPPDDVTIRYRQVRLLRGDGDGATTMDLQRHWITYLVYAVAFELAMDNSIDLEYCRELKSERDRLRGRSLARNAPKGPVTMHVTNRGPWR
jgi:hypothetical protein